MQKCIFIRQDSLWGRVKILPMKIPDTLQAYDNRQAHSHALRVYAQIGNSELGKLEGGIETDSTGCQADINIRYDY